MAKERRLGRGLEALLGSIAGPEPFDHTASVPTESSVPLESDTDWLLQQRLANNVPGKVDILKIDCNPFQPRLDFVEAELDALAQNLETHGMLQPIVVRKMDDANNAANERYQIIAGERRFRAATRAGWSEVPVHCVDVDDRQMIELALTENLQRKDLNAIEKARSFSKYLETYGGTHEELGRRLGFDRSTIANLIRLLDLATDVQEAVQRGELSQGHARALLPLEAWEQVEIAQQILAEGWSVRTTERYVQDLLDGLSEGRPAQATQGGAWNVIGQDGKRRPAAVQSEQIMRLEQDFRACLGGMKVKLTQANEKGKGKLVIAFSDHAEFERIYAAICENPRSQSAAS